MCNLILDGDGLVMSQNGHLYWFTEDKTFNICYNDCPYINFNSAFTLIYSKYSAKITSDQTLSVNNNGLEDLSHRSMQIVE